MQTAVDFLGGPYESEVFYTLVVVRDTSNPENPNLLMGRKTRGFGEGKLVFPGGKIREYTGLGGIAIKPIPLEAARELKEETGLAVVGLENCARIGIDDSNDEMRSIYVMLGDYNAEDRTPLYPSSEFSELGWNPVNKLDYSDMPDDYKLWLPEILQGKFVWTLINLHEGQPDSDPLVFAVPPTDRN